MIINPSLVIGMEQLTFSGLFVPFITNEAGGRNGSD
jgi:hypothetical protein